MHERSAFSFASTAGGPGAVARAVALALVLLCIAPPAFAAELVGQLLVARPEIPDPRFAETVVLVVADDETGTVGVVLNRPLGPLPISQVLDAFGLPAVPGAGRRTVEALAGGPVEPDLAVCVHGGDYEDDGTRRIADGIRLSAGGPLLQAIAEGKGPRQVRLAFGYAGWGPGQLAREVSAGNWDLVPAEPALVFGADPGGMWAAARAKRGISL